MARDHIPGVSLATFDSHDHIKIRSYGIANLETNSKVTPHTVFRIASLSKQFNAYAALSECEEGKLSLSTTVSKFFPDVPPAFGAITIKDILGHRSGIADPAAAFDYAKDYTDQEYIDLLTSNPLVELPGSTYRYNNHAYSLLGLIVGRVAGSSLPEVVQSKIFGPLKMTDSRYYNMEDVVPNRADGYDWKDEHYVHRLELRPRIFAGSGGILTTISDMAKYEMALRHPGILSQRVLDQQWTPMFGGEKGYGAGWHVDLTDGQNLLTHTGTTFGFTSAYIRDRKANVTVLLMRNATGGKALDWANQILAILEKKLAPVLSSTSGD